MTGIPDMLRFRRVVAVIVGCGFTALGPGCAMIRPAMPTFAPSQPQAAPAESATPTPHRSNMPTAPSAPAEQRNKPASPSQSVPPQNPAQDLDDAPTWEQELKSGADESTPWRSNLPPLPAPGDPLETELGAPEAFPGTDSRTARMETVAQRVDAQPVTVVNNLWLSTARSSGQRPIEVARVGRGKDYVLVVGSVYGNEPEAITLMDGFNREIRSGGVPNDLVVLMVRTPNPDGLAERIRTNSLGVDLNRNYPSLNFPATPDQLTGAHPGSEPETQFMLRVFKEYSPTRVIHVRSSIGNRPLVLVNDRYRVDELRQTLASSADVNAFSGDLKAGSIEEFVQVRLGLPMATVLLPPQGFGELQPRDLLKLTTASIAPGSGRPASSDSPLNSTESAPASRTVADGIKGNVELLPSPPGSQATQDEAGATSARFEELPPPPR